MTNPVCILGCGRSGTSIFGELFQSLPDYQYYSEPEWSEFTTINFQLPTAVKVPRPDPNTPSTPGLPFFLDDFLEIFPENGVMFWQVRHPLDTICSLRVGISNNWGHHPQPPDYVEWQRQPLAVQCAYHWNYINTVGYQNLAELVVVNRFEDMVTSPLEVAVARAKEAGVETSSCFENIEQWALRVQDGSNDRFIEAECSKPYSRKDHSKKIGRWQENLTAAEVDQVLPIIRETGNLFGYDLDGI